jgi:hypothetical protein
MINPNHECWNTRRHKTVIELDQGQLNGAGVSLRVLMHGLKGQDVVWFSAIFGIHRDNCIALGVACNESLVLEKTVDHGMAPIRSAIQGDFEIDEYMLAKSVQSALGVVIERGDDPDVLNDIHGPREVRNDKLHDEGIHGVHIRIDVHDDCFFKVAPVEGTTLRSLVHAILEQHSFYLQREVNWEPVLDELIQIATRVPALELKSDARRGHLILTVIRPEASMKQGLFASRPRYVVNAGTGTAFFVSRPSHIHQRYTK